MNPLHYDPPPASALFADRRPGLRAATLEELDQIVENSSEKNRNFFIAYLGLLVYVQAIVFSTTDLQLLTGTALKLPIVDLDVPLVGFYVVVPIFVIALHFNFLQNLESHHYKLMRWRDAHPGGLVPRARIQPFLFDYAMLETGSQMERMVRWANSLLVLNLAPITLGLLLWRYTDRQEAWVTVWHYLAFLFDSHLVWKLRVASRRNQNPDTAEPLSHGWRLWLSPVLTAGRFLRDIPRHGMRGGFGLFLLAETVFTVAVSAWSSETFPAYCLPLARQLKRLEDPIESLLVPRITLDPRDAVWRPDGKFLEVEAKMAGEADWVKYFNTQGKGFLPSTSHLRLAGLSHQQLPRAQMKEAKLEGANLGFAALQGADLVRSNLQSSDLRDARLQGADLGFAHLQGAYLRGARLSGADLGGAYMQGSNLSDAQLLGADLSGSKLIGANLARTQLQGTILRFTALQGANLRCTQLQGADLAGVQLQGAILGHTALRGAISPEPSEVFLLDPPFDPLVVEWRKIEVVAMTVPDESKLSDGLSARQGFLRRMREVKTWPDDAEKSLQHNPETAYRDLLPSLCRAFGYELGRSRLALVEGVRNTYRYRDRRRCEVQPAPELESTLTEIDRILCTLPACADLKGDIDGLDCSPFTAARPPPESKR